METYNSTTFGIYLQVDIIKGERIEKYLESPRTKKTFRVGEAQFCPKSGMALIEKEKVHKEYVYPCTYDLEGFEGYEEDMFLAPAYVGGTDRHGILIFNQSDKFSQTMDEDDGCCEVPENWKELKIEFEEKYKEYIELFKQEFGSCHVRYGVVNHAS